VAGVAWLPRHLIGLLVPFITIQHRWPMTCTGGFVTGINRRFRTSLKSRVDSTSKVSALANIRDREEGYMDIDSSSDYQSGL